MAASGQHHGVNPEPGSDRETGVLEFLGRNRMLVQGLIDAAAWSLALIFGTLFRYDFNLAEGSYGGLPAIIPIALVLQVVAGLICGLYTGRARFGSFDEVMSLVKATTVTVVALMIVDLVPERRLVPASVPIVSGALALVLMAGVRYCWRLAIERKRRPSGDHCHRLLVFGAGEGATQVIPALLRDPDSEFIPVGLLDDDPGKRKLRIMGIPVLGDRTRMVEAARECRADSLLIAMPSAGPELVTELSELARVAGLDAKVLPPVRDLFGGHVGASDIRDVTTADLLGRHEIDTDLEAIAGYLTGKRILVTGAGGSIGSELCKQIYRFAPARLFMLDRDESALHGVQLAIEGRALLTSPDLILCDLRDRRAVQEVFTRTRPDVVFHAAALKHLTLLEQHPAEAVKTNVWATLDLLEITAKAGVKRFVNISTDKAADPCSVLGYTKRLTERLTSHFASEASGTYLGVQAQVRASCRHNGVVNGVAADPLNTMNGPGIVIAGGTSPTFYDASSDTVERWGDYSAVVMDTVNANRAWVINEKILSNTVWGSRIGLIGY